MRQQGPHPPFEHPLAPGFPQSLPFVITLHFLLSSCTFGRGAAISTLCSTLCARALTCCAMTSSVEMAPGSWTRVHTNQQKTSMADCPVNVRSSKHQNKPLKCLLQARDHLEDTEKSIQQGLRCNCYSGRASRGTANVNSVTSKLEETC